VVEIQSDTFALAEGTQTKSVTLEVGNQDSDPVTVSFKFSVASEVTLTPPLIDFGAIAPGKPSKLQLVAKLNTRLPEIQVLGFDLQGSPAFSSSKIKKEAADTYSVDIDLSSDVASGFHFGTGILRTSSEAMPTIRIPVRASVK